MIDLHEALERDFHRRQGKTLMGRPSVIPGIKVRLEAWRDEREAEYLAQPDRYRG